MICGIFTKNVEPALTLFSRLERAKEGDSGLEGKENSDLEEVYLSLNNVYIIYKNLDLNDPLSSPGFGCKRR